MRVLVADDDPVTRHTVAALVRAHGHDPIIARDGAEALALHEADPFAVVVTDWHMPDLDGLGLLARIRAGDRDRYTYVIMLTGTGREAAAEAMEAGVDDFLVKPVAPAELGVRLRVAERIGAMQERIAAAGRQLDRDLAAAEKLQRGLLPTQTPPGLGIEAAWRFAPCGRVGGDALNLIRLDERHAAFYLLDVVGHGIPAALLAVQVHRLMSPLMSASSLLKRPLQGPPWYEVVPPRQVILGLADQFRAAFDRMEAFTLCYGVLHIDRHEVEIANAGHPVIVHRQAGGCAAIDMPSLPVGYFPAEQMDPPTVRLRLAPGDALILASDGLSEALRADGEELGVDRLMAAAAGAGDDAGAIAEAAMSAAIVWRGAPATDDQTVLVLHRPG